MMSSDSKPEETKLVYQPYASILNPGFWQKLTNLKLNKLKLSTEPVDIHGSYSCDLSSTLPCLASFDHDSFSEKPEYNNRSSSPLYGRLVCTNIIQEFADYDKADFLKKIGAEIWSSICDGKALSEPERYLSRFGLLVHADLKKYKFYYWFCFPALNHPATVNQLGKSISVLERFSEKSLDNLREEYNKPEIEREFSRGYYIVKSFKLATGEDGLQCYPLIHYVEAIAPKDGQEDVQLYFAFNDPCANPQYPGWPLRNYLCLIATQFKLRHIKILRLRKGQSSATCKNEFHHSRILEVDVKLPPLCDPLDPERRDVVPHVVGWEKNESQHLAPKLVNLSNLLDPKRLAEDAVNLNLRLMKWRLLPKLDLDKIAENRCLLLGCGTLGCHIARGLLAWGIKNISIVDNAKISYSNPVRQSLYTFDDCIATQGAFKAEVAASNLKKIHPTADVKPYVMSIPMPGHHIADKELDQTKKSITTLENLIKDHDTIFLLMDTRESRWLPTVIAMSMQKLVINAAIGFDTFLLQRYGIRDYDQAESSASKDYELPRDQSEVKTTKQMPSEHLGCYFCNDIVAPGDSTLDRTLDQQCTVSRPGVSMMVSAMAVELLASILSSNMGSRTPAPIDFDNNPSYPDEELFTSELGIVPHSIRGNLARYYTYMPTSPAFNKCSACSWNVINAYRTSGFEFLQRVFDDPNYLEEIAGLKDLQNVSDNVWVIESDDESEFGHIDNRIKI